MCNWSEKTPVRTTWTFVLPLTLLLQQDNMFLHI